MTIEELGKKIREARDRVNQKRKEDGQPPITQTDIAKALGATKKSVGEWERGESQPKALYLYGYCEALGITLDELFGVKKNAFCAM